MPRRAAGGPRLDAVHAIVGQKYDARAGDREAVGMARAVARLYIGEQRRARSGAVAAPRLAAVLVVVGREHAGVEQTCGGEARGRDRTQGRAARCVPAAVPSLAQSASPPSSVARNIARPATVPTNRGVCRPSAIGPVPAALPSLAHRTGGVASGWKKR